MKKAHLTLCLGIGTLLFLAVGAQFWTPGWDSGSPGKGAHLAEAFPKAVSGVPAKDLELGSTETLRTAVERTLRYDDVLFREYRLAGATISIYAAYWGPGRMPTQLVASHTPDRCWTEVGWLCEERRHGVSTGVTGGDFLPGEWRLFRAPTGQRLNVIFWHLVGREVHDYGERLNRVPSVWRWWRDATRQIIKAPGEQYFIRVTSDVPFEDLQTDPGWQELIAALGRIGLAGNAAAAAR